MSNALGNFVLALAGETLADANRKIERLLRERDEACAELEACRSASKRNASTEPSAVCSQFANCEYAGLNADLNGGAGALSDEAKTQDQSNVMPPVAAPVSQHEPATVVENEFGVELHVYGVVVKSWVGAGKWGEFANSMAARINAASRFRAPGRNAQPNSSDTATIAQSKAGNGQA